MPISSGSHYFEGGFSEVWQRIASQQPFPDECLVRPGGRQRRRAELGGGRFPPAGSVDVSHETFFSPEGHSLAVTFADSVPGPADISLDPVVIASSAAIAAGVVVFMPFPAALFNSTLQEHYAEVMAAVARFRRLAGNASSRWASPACVGPWPTCGRVARPARPRPRSDSAAEPSTPEARPASRWFTLDEAFWRSPLGILAFLLVSALLNGLLDPTFGFAVESVATFLGLALGMGVMLLAFAVPLFIGARGLKAG